MFRAHRRITDLAGRTDSFFVKLDAVQRLRFYTSALLKGSISPDHVLEDWRDWYQLVPAFVATYGTEEL
jgi:hypothetical protein